VVPAVRQDLLGVSPLRLGVMRRMRIVIMPPTFSPFPQFGEGTIPTLIDAATFVHLAAMAAGCGAVVFADSTLLRRPSRPFGRGQLAVIEHAHGIITIALVLLWLSGLALLGLKIGFDPARFSPKLVTKLGTVTMLTVTAVAMACYALPYLRANLGRRLIDAPLPQQSALALCAAMSAAGWSTALLLGSSKILKTAGEEVMVMGACLHGLAVGAALALAVAVHVVRRGERSGGADGLTTVAVVMVGDKAARRGG